MSAFYMNKVASGILNFGNPFCSSLLKKGMSKWNEFPSNLFYCYSFNIIKTRSFREIISKVGVYNFAFSRQTLFNFKEHDNGSICLYF